MSRSKHQPLAQINVVPYVDVMLVLLVIFMVTAPLITEGVKVNLPQAKAKALPPGERLPLIVTINKAGQYFLNVAEHPDQAFDTDELAIRLAAERQRHPDRPVFVRGDDQASYGDVVSAMVLLNQAGVDNVGLMTAPIEKVG